MNIFQNKHKCSINFFFIQSINNFTLRMNRNILDGTCQTFQRNKSFGTIKHWTCYETNK